MTREFILDTLLPYKLNPELRAYESPNCVYLARDGRKCAIGKHMKVGEWQKFDMGGVQDLFEVYSEEEIMSEEWVGQKIPPMVAEYIQYCHDMQFSLTSIDFLEKGTNFKFPELR